MPSAVREYQSALAATLTARFGNIPVLCEWSSMTGVRNQYSPRLDVAVGPFAKGSTNCTATYDELVREHASLLRRLLLHSNHNCQRIGDPAEGEFETFAHFNGNARCFLAIEIENATSRKHLMGGAINAAALGRIGIAVGWTDKQVSQLARLRTYLRFLAGVGKNTFDTTNLLILSAEQLAFESGRA